MKYVQRDYALLAPKPFNFGIRCAHWPKAWKDDRTSNELWSILQARTIIEGLDREMRYCSELKCNHSVDYILGKLGHYLKGSNNDYYGMREQFLQEIYPEYEKIGNNWYNWERNEQHIKNGTKQYDSNTEINLTNKSIMECKAEIKRAIYRVVEDDQHAHKLEGCYHRIIWSKLDALPIKLCKKLLAELVEEGKIYADSTYRYFKASTW